MYYLEVLGSPRHLRRVPWNERMAGMAGNWAIGSSLASGLSPTEPGWLACGPAEWSGSGVVGGLSHATRPASSPSQVRHEGAVTSLFASQERGVERMLQQCDASKTHGCRTGRVVTKICGTGRRNEKSGGVVTSPVSDLKREGRPSSTLNAASSPFLFSL